MPVLNRKEAITHVIGPGVIAIHESANLDHDDGDIAIKDMSLTFVTQNDPLSRFVLFRKDSPMMSIGQKVKAVFTKTIDRLIDYLDSDLSEEDFSSTSDQGSPHPKESRPERPTPITALDLEPEARGTSKDLQHQENIVLFDESFTILAGLGPYTIVRATSKKAAPERKGRSSSRTVHFRDPSAPPRSNTFSQSEGDAGIFSLPLLGRKNVESRPARRSESNLSHGRDRLIRPRSRRKLAVEVERDRVKARAKKEVREDDERGRKAEEERENRKGMEEQEGRESSEDRKAMTNAERLMDEGLDLRTYLERCDKRGHVQYGAGGRIRPRCRNLFWLATGRRALDL